jgi:uncharacterized protein YpmB
MDNITVIVEDYPQEITVQVTTTGITVNQANQIIANTLKVSDINHVSIELPNVDNTSDLNKPVSDATNEVLNAETTSRTNADALLQSNIDTESSTRLASDDTLQTNIDSEATTRLNSDVLLQSNIDAEELARANADTLLQSNIDAEALTRLNNDNTLQSNIDGLDTRVSLNDAKVGITTAQANEIVANNSKVGITTSQANEIVANNAKVGYTEALVSANASVTANTNKVGITTAQANEITANNAKISFDNTSSARLANTSGTNTGNQNANAVPLDDTNLIVAKETNIQAFAESVDSSLLKARGTGISSTYVSTVVIGGTTFSQPAVKGEISSDEGYFNIDYAGASGITVTNLSIPSIYVYIDKNGALQQQTSTPTRQDWSRKVFTMRIALDLSTNLIIGFEYLNNPIGHYANSIRDIYSYLLAQGVPFKKDQLVTGRSTDLGFDISEGSLMEFGGTGDINNANIKNFNQVLNATFFLATRTAFDAGNNTNLPKFWDNNGVLTALGSTTLVGHRLYRFSNGNIVMQYGQGNYANMVLAKAGVVLEDYVLNPILKNATFFGWWFVESTATNTGGTTLTDFVEYTLGIQGGSSSGLSGCLLKGNNLSDLLDLPQTLINLGLQNIDNTSDLNKPISTATQSALDLKVNLIQDSINTKNTFKSVSFAMDYSDRVRDDSGNIESRDSVMNKYLKMIN